MINSVEDVPIFLLLALEAAFEVSWVPENGRVPTMRQSQAMTVMMSNSSVFLTGAPGSGKSYVLGKFVSKA